MSLKAQTDTEGSDTQSTWDPTPNPWKWYKRFSDNKKVEARLLPGHHLYFPGGPLIEVRESEMEDFICPHCKVLLSKGNGKGFPKVLLPVPLFHERHRPLDDK